MEFLDERKDTKKPASASLLQLKDEIIKRHSQDEHSKNAVIMLCDYDFKLGNREHLQMNFEPELLDDSFKKEWLARTSKRINILLLENTEWKRYAWGVYEDVPIICDDCNTLHGEHKCHGENAFVRGEPTGKPCECRECRIGDKLFPGAARIRDDCSHKWRNIGGTTLKCKNCGEKLYLTKEEWDRFKNLKKWN